MSIFDGTVSPTTGPGFAIGVHSQINGADAESSGVIVTMHELEQVYRYWFRERLHNDFWRFFYEQSGSYEWRLAVYSRQRLGVIDEVLGNNRTREICDQIISAYRLEHSIGDETWRVFTTASPEEQEAWLEIHGGQALMEGRQ